MKARARARDNRQKCGRDATGGNRRRASDIRYRLPGGGRIEYVSQTGWSADNKQQRVQGKQHMRNRVSAKHRAPSECHACQRQGHTPGPINPTPTGPLSRSAASQLLLLGTVSVRASLISPQPEPHADMPD
ncbi:hypothetical protein DPEC_G00323570 [Dallia pectoralis]|uniref:Uncharacterized protein n=1 Tax=Dallia pectoralis TaxID=75939 RepID=A0ACC2FB18_DALPE|nr:hypothetical protein DPEC_G00323570 [Dallia pectoralis]